MRIDVHEALHRILGREYGSVSLDPFFSGISWGVCGRGREWGKKRHVYPSYFVGFDYLSRDFTEKESFRSGSFAVSFVLSIYFLPFFSKMYMMDTDRYVGLGTQI